MLNNRSIPDATVIPELAYRDVGEAVDWLKNAFGFTLRLRIANHRAQLNVAAGAVILVEASAGDLEHIASLERPLVIMVLVDDIDRHYSRTKSRVDVLSSPADHAYGERQYSCRDLGGYVWTFSQTIRDVAPEAWGGSIV